MNQPPPSPAVDAPDAPGGPDEAAPVRKRRRGPGPFTLLALPGLIVLVGSVVFLTVAGRLPGTGSGEAETPATAARDAAADRVDASYVPWLREAGKRCTVVPPSVLAAQVDAHSGWRADTAALSDASGLVGFGAAQWREWGKDEDGNGRSSPGDPVDAIMALGRQDCALAGKVTALRTRGTVTGELLDLTLAAYETGPEAVEKAGGVPAKARPYVKRVTQLARSYKSFDKKAPPAGTGTGTGSSGSLQPPLRTPLTITSPYGSREHPLTGVTKLHTGVDFAAGEGTPVTAAWQGTVTFAGLTKAYGNRVVVDHGSVGGKRLQTTYSHLSVLRVTQGQSVTAGAVVGDVGSTGLSTGPHLHFEVVLDGYYTDPMPWLGTKG